jgi:hypothetical protein
VLVGLSIGILGGLFLDLIHAEQLLKPFALKAYQNAKASSGPSMAKARLTFKQRHEFAKQELREIFSYVWKWVFIGVGLGAALHGFVPQAWFEANLGGGQWWTVPLATIAGIPLYSNATGFIPVMESLLMKGVPLGTTLAFCMSIVAASFPKFVLLKQVMEWKLLIIVFLMLLVSFTLSGWVLNFFYII